MDDSLVSRSTEFQAAIQNGERASLRTVCEKKEQESESEDDKETRVFLKVMFEDDGTARSKLLTHLGFNAPDEGKGDVQEDVVQQVNDLTVQENVDETAGYPKDRENAAFSFDNEEDFFNNLSSPKADDTPVSTSVNHFASEETVPTEDHVQGGSYVQEESTDPAFDEAVQRALVMCDYKGAVAQCLTANRIADALVIAHVGGPSLWESTRDQYLKKNNAPYLKVVSAMVNRDLTAVVNTRPLKYWKETLALVRTFAQGEEEWTSLCGTLASKLMASGYTLASTLCYICAGNIDKTVEIWSSSLSSDSEGKCYADSLQDLMEKTIMFVLATGQKQLSSALCKLFEKYLEILASQGLLSTAMDYFKLLGEDLSPELLILRDRIAFSTESVEEEAPAVHTGTVNAANQTNYQMTEDPQHHYQNIAQPQQLQAQQHFFPSQVPQDDEVCAEPNESRNPSSPTVRPAQPEVVPPTAPPVQTADTGIAIENIAQPQQLQAQQQQMVFPSQTIQVPQDDESRNPSSPTVRPAQPEDVPPTAPPVQTADTGIAIEEVNHHSEFQDLGTNPTNPTRTSERIRILKERKEIQMQQSLNQAQSQTQSKRKRKRKSKPKPAPAPAPAPAEEDSYADNAEEDYDADNAEEDYDAEENADHGPISLLGRGRLLRNYIYTFTCTDTTSYEGYKVVGKWRNGEEVGMTIITQSLHKQLEECQKSDRCLQSEY